MSPRSSVRRSRPSGTAAMDELGRVSAPSADPDRALVEVGGEIDAECVVCRFVAEAVERRAFFIFVEAVGEPWFIAKMRAGGFCGPHVRDLVASGRGPRLTGPFEDVLEGWLARRRALGGAGLPAVGEACPICETAAWAADHALGLLASGDARRIEVGLGRSEPICLPHLDELIDRLSWPERVGAAQRWAERLLEAVALATRAELEAMADGERSRSEGAGAPPAPGRWYSPGEQRSGEGAEAASRALRSAAVPEPLAAATGASGGPLAGVVDILAGSQASLQRRTTHRELQASQPEEGPPGSHRRSPPAGAAQGAPAVAPSAAALGASPEPRAPTLAEAWHDGLITEAGLAAELAAGRCPVCTAVAAAPRRLLAWLAAPASTDRDRRDLDALCGDHLRDLAAFAPESAAAVVRSALERRLAMLAALPTIADQPPRPIVARVGWSWRRARVRRGDEAPASRLAALREIWRVVRSPGELIEERLRRARLAADRECVACLAAVTARRRTFVLLGATLRGRRGRDRFEVSGGLCLRHAGAAPAATSGTGAAFDAAGLALVAAVAEARCATILFELGEALRKSSWSVRFEPPGPEGTAWQRAATFALGEAALPSAVGSGGRTIGAAPEPIRPRRAL